MELQGSVCIDRFTLSKLSCHNWRFKVLMVNPLEFETADLDSNHIVASH